MKGIGTMAIGIKTPFIKEGDDINEIVVNSIIEATEHNFYISDGDIIAITESAIARAQNNFVTTDDVAHSIKTKFAESDKKIDKLGIVHPITSRNRFSMILKAAAKASNEIILILKYPFDEVGNQIFDLPFGQVDIMKDTLYERDVYELDPDAKHPITGVDYIKMYREIIEAENCKATIVFSNDVTKVLKYTHNVLVSDIHTRANTKKILNRITNKYVNKLQLENYFKVFGLDEIMNEQQFRTNIEKSTRTSTILETTPIGYNPEFGLLGSNIATDDTLKLFPRDCDTYVNDIKLLFKERTGKDVEVLIYGDGAFKDPVSGIWELADPLVCPAFTKGLMGSPNEVKLKYLIDNDMLDQIDNTDEEDNKLGTTPRQISDLLGSLADLVSGSGDKGTPVVYIKNYFKKYNDR